MDQDALDQIATLNFGLQALQGQIVVLQDGQMEIASNCEPWTVRRLASHALNNQLFWAGTVAGEESVSFEATMGAEPYNGDLGQFAGEVARRALEMWRTDGVFDASHVTPLGELPGTVVVNFAIVDALCHAWDIAASVGVPIEFPTEMIPTIELVVAATCTDAARDHDLIKPVPPTPADATATEHLMALAGRAIPR
jgi:uncharacterized protein (TIGR03086 family)